LSTETKGTQNKKKPQRDFGCFCGNISIMGSGGSHKVMGNFAPTTKSTKNDACLQIGTGQSRCNPINVKLDELACSNQVIAIFLNERYYHHLPDNHEIDHNATNTLRFLGYYEFYESKFVMGDAHKDIQTEFEDPPDSVWQYLTFRLHPHLRIEANLFIDNYEELDILMGEDDDFQYQKIVIDHNDHGDIAYDIADTGGWMTYNHSLTIQELIIAMIDNGNVGNLCGEKNQDFLDTAHNEDSTNDYSEYNDMDDADILKKTNVGGQFVQSTML
jgi:hypothetical protein